MKKYNFPKDELDEHIVNSIERRAEQDALHQLESIDEAELRRVINSRRRESRQSAYPSGFRLLFAIGSVAAVIALVWLGFQPKYSAVELYRDYNTIAVYEPEPLSRGASILNSGHILAYETAVKHYLAGDYAAAVESFRYACQGLELKDTPETIIYYSAVALIQIDKNGEAIEKLSYLSALSTSVFRFDAQWELALVYLKTGNRVEAKKILTEISVGNGAFADKAKELLSKMSQKLWF